MNTKKIIRGTAYAIAGAGLMAIGYIVGEIRAINNCSESAYKALRGIDDGLTNVKFEKGGTVMTRSYLNDIPREEVETED